MGTGQYRIRVAGSQFLIGNRVTIVMQIFAHFFVSVVPLIGGFLQAFNKNFVLMIQLVSQNVDFLFTGRRHCVFTGQFHARGSR